MIRARQVADFIRAQDLGVPVPTTSHAIKIVPDDDVAQGVLPSKPDRLVAVNLPGGAGTLRQRTFDRPTVQIMCRGMQRHDEDSEALAAAVDNVLMGALPPFAMGDRRVVSIDYLGGPPSLLTRDDAHRAVIACNYTLQVDREVY